MEFNATFGTSQILSKKLWESSCCGGRPSKKRRAHVTTYMCVCVWRSQKEEERRAAAYCHWCCLSAASDERGKNCLRRDPTPNIPEKKTKKENIWQKLMRKTLFYLAKKFKKSRRLSIPILGFYSWKEEEERGGEDVSGRLFQSAIFFRSFFCVYICEERASTWASKNVGGGGGEKKRREQWTVDRWFWGEFA